MALIVVISFCLATGTWSNTSLTWDSKTCPVHRRQGPSRHLPSVGNCSILFLLRAWGRCDCVQLLQSVIVARTQVFIAPTRVDLEQILGRSNLGFGGSTKIFLCAFSGSYEEQTIFWVHTRFGKRGNKWNINTALLHFGVVFDVWRVRQGLHKSRLLLHSKSLLAASA